MNLPESGFCIDLEMERPKSNNASMKDESLLVVIMLLGIAVMIVVLVRYQRGKERQLASRMEIEIPIESIWRTVLVVLPSMAAGPVITAFLDRMDRPFRFADIVG
jgi:uncharacterized membrane protein YidH (DUF202 family)